MRVPARELLCIHHMGEETPGLAFYSLREPDGVDVEFPSEMVPYVDAVQRFTLHGPGWRVFRWEVAIDAWAAGSVLVPALIAVLNRLNDHAGRVSWIGDGLLFCDPPELFSPSCMSGGVLLAVDDMGRVYGHLDPDEPIEPLDDATMLELRRVAVGLADLDEEE